jgi:multicomponent Na+:H+ antiporter subunit E
MIRAFLMNLFLAVVYVALAGRVNALSFLKGFAIGYLLITLYCMTTQKPNYGFKVVKLLRFLIYFIFILTKANLQIAWEIITPGLNQTPRILRYSVEELSEVELTTLANCITLTPGTLVIDVSDDNKWLYIHCMYAKDRASAIAELDELATKLKREVFS